jgi:hypothetical protein
MFFADTRQQLVVEGAARYSTAACASTLVPCDFHSIAGGARYQVAVGRRGVLVFDAFAARDVLRGTMIGPGGDDGRVRVGGRAELLVKF